MASLSYHKGRQLWRVDYRIALGTQRRRRTKYAKTQAAGQSLFTHLAAVEAATRTGIVKLDQVWEWIALGYIESDEAAAAFPGFEETDPRTSQATVDYDSILSSYEDYAIRTSKAKDPFRKTHQNHMSVARQVLDWLQKQDLRHISEEDCRSYQYDMESQYAPWTVFHRLTKLRLLLDQAVAMGMISSNPARNLTLRQPKQVAA